MSKQLRDFAEYGSIGISWVISSLLYVYLCFRGGAWVDAKLGTDPLFTLVGLLVGIGMSLYSLVEQLLRIESAWRKGKPRNGKGEAGPRGETPPNKRRD